ncbi:hypothetical protein I302_104725 [Kwoniella bestiolae CBS 10118]|uniref:U3 small nucleolar ribonucleoprotein protein MPP10 n=1 Tax=Kwoniella bestiolae CBS 10118 TaxID=1296100 RepID=A0A1B9FRY0_9TREE|nr:U3 small nucleolar RNA-associated protein MPP10 [Kwoniella bestiolae CBS 10118]OCF21525.1 U3 small nucleolar RNA-associated protein MPP10 [Kwoniella bestiolae CBS 10118]
MSVPSDQANDPISQPLSTSLGELSNLIEERPWILAAAEGDQKVAEKALQVTKDIFDLGISLEPTSHSHLHPFLLSILEPPSINTRSQSKSKQPTQPEEDAKPDVESFLPYTPLSVLTVDGLDPEQIWAQLELRSEGLSKVIKEVGGSTNNMEEEDALQDMESDGEEGSDEDMSIEEFRQMLIESGETQAAEMDEDELRELMDDLDEDDSDEDEDSEDEDSEDEEGIKFGDEDEEEISGSEDHAEEEDEEDDLEGSEEEDVEMDEFDLDEEEDGEDEDGEEDEEEEEDEGEDEDEEEDDSSALFGAGPSRARGKKAHPTLDDDFFSIDDFNRQTEELEAGRLTSGRLGGDEDDEEELQDVGGMMLSGAGDDEEIMYSDFFEKPRGLPKPAATATGKGKGKGKEPKTKAKGKGKGKGVRFDEDDLMDQDEEDEEEDENAAYETMGRMKGDLFDSDDEEDGEEKNLSNHEKRQLALAQQIAELESEAVGPKDWTLLGEATSKARPENSLLEENLDFEQVQKVVPVITDDVVKSLEEIIKTRILDNNFDSPVRVRAYEPTPFLPSRYFELQETQSNKSLAQIYEEEYQAASSGTKVTDQRDEKLRKQHDEIEKIWNEVCYKLDALSSLNFVPKAPKAQISTISDLPTTSMETALPSTMGTSTMLAPEELFQPPTSASLVARSELTPEEAQRARQKNRKVKQSQQKKLSGMAELYGKKKKSVREEKEEALKGLVKTGKGVTVIGKGGKELEKSKKRGGPESGENREGGKRLKL